MDDDWVPALLARPPPTSADVVREDRTLDRTGLPTSADPADDARGEFGGMGLATLGLSPMLRLDDARVGDDGFTASISSASRWSPDDGEGTGSSAEPTLSPPLDFLFGRVAESAKSPEDAELMRVETPGSAG